MDKAIFIYSELLLRSDLTRAEKRLAFFNLGVIHHRKGEQSKGLEYWEEAVSLPFDSTDAFVNEEELELAASASMNLGAHHVLAKDIEKGLSYLREAVRLNSEDGEIRYNLAATLAGVGKFDEAVKEFEEAEKRGIEMAKDVKEKLKKGMEANEKSELKR